VVIEIQGKKHEFNEYIGETTKIRLNIKPSSLALEKARELAVEEIDLFLDSELVCQQLNRQYKVKNQDFSAAFIKVWDI
jgi:ribonuclease HI